MEDGKILRNVTPGAQINVLGTWYEVSTESKPAPKEWISKRLIKCFPVSRNGVANYGINEWLPDDTPISFN